MTAVDEAVPPSTASPRPARRRTVLGWLLVVVLVLGVALVAMTVAVNTPGQRGSLDPEGRQDAGALALAEILRDRGVGVEVLRSHEAARRAIDENTTLVMANPFALSDEAVSDLIAPADRVVFLSSSSRLLELLDIGTDAGGTLPSAEPGCTVPEFARVGTIRPDRLFSPAAGVTACFGDDEAAAVLVDERGTSTHVVVEGARLFANDVLAENGNAALGLALLGQTDHVVWYVPSFADGDIEGQPIDTLGSLTPDWVTPVILLLLLSGIAAAIWRGRRFGPLVAETLPVTVRASETMHGRARLTAKAADAGHAAQALRDGTQRRLARRLGLAVTAHADEVADAASDRLRIPRGTLQGLLAGPLPANDADLVELARRLSDLEQAVEVGIRPRDAAAPPNTVSPSLPPEAEDTP